MQSETINTRLRVVEVDLATKDVRIIRFSRVDSLMNVSAGAHLTFEFMSKGELITRTYSAVDDGQAPGLLTIAVKYEEASRGGSAHMWSLTPGDEINVIGTGNSMPVSYSAPHYLLIAGGIGITPMIGIARSLIAAGKSVKMAYCAKSRDHAAFADSLEQMLGKDLTLFLSDEGNRLDVDALIENTAPATLVYFCGPLRLAEAVKSAWSQRYLPVQNLRYETFASSGSRPAQTFQVTVQETGKTIQVLEQQSLLDALVESGHEVIYECLKGECGLCKVEIVETNSEIDHRDVFLSDQERLEGKALCCCVSRLARGEAKIRIDGIQHGRSA